MNDIEHQARLLVDHLQKVQDNFSSALKEAYICGIRDGRDYDYMGCDALARWESSEIKKEVDKNETI
jgi:hypothetical protein